MIKRCIESQGSLVYSISNDKYEDLKIKAISTICLNLTPEVKYSVLNETSS